MATTFTNAGASNVAPATLKLSPDKYVALGTLVDDWSKPDNRDLLVSTYGDQGITGFLQLTGAVTNAGTQDEVQYWEEGRLHKKVAIASGGIVAGATGEIVVADYSDDDGETQAARNNCRLNDVLLSPGGQRLVVTELDDTNEKVKFKRLDGNAVSVEGSATELAIIGNIYAQGTAQPTEFYQTEIIKRTNPFIITKETYAVNGSQATNIGWVNLGNGDYRWYVKGEQDTRKRFMNQREMMLLYGMTGTAGNSITLADGKVTGSEGSK